MRREIARYRESKLREDEEPADSVRPSLAYRAIIAGAARAGGAGRRGRSSRNTSIVDKHGR